MKVVEIGKLFKILSPFSNRFQWAVVAEWSSALSTLNLQQ